MDACAREDFAQISETPVIGMLCWGEGENPRGLEQLAELPGNSTNPATFSFPIRYRRVQGANFRTIVEEPDAKIRDAMIAAARELESQGIRAITTSCGFNAILQQDLAAAVTIPVCTSSLMQVPLAYRMLSPNRRIGILTARKASLTKAHLERVGIDPRIPLLVCGLESSKQWRLLHDHPDKEIDVKELERDVVDAAVQMVRDNPAAGAIILECTDIPPFACAIQHATGLAVFDIVTLVNLLHATVVREKFKLR